MLSLDDIQLLPPSKWQDFESLCRELYRAEWGDFFAQKHGRPGHAQQGVDVFGTLKDTAAWAGVQCKTKDLLVRASLTEQELREEVKKARAFTPPLKHFVIATTAPRDPALQRLARQITERHRRQGFFSVHVVSWDDITDMLAHHPRVASRYYPYAFPAPQPAQPLFTQAAAPSPQGSARNPGPQRSRGPTRLVLPRHTTHALALLASSPLPLPEEALRQLFPAIRWTEEIAVLRREKAITTSDGLWEVSSQTAAVLLRDEAEQAALHGEWIEALRPHSAHPDTALFLATHLLAAGNLAEAVKLLAGVAESLEPGYWNDTYSRTLVTLDTPKVQRALSSEERLSYLHAVGLCLSRGPSPEEALPWLSRLRRASEGSRSSWASGQASLLTGVVHHRAGDWLEAKGHFEQAVQHARTHRNFLQLGHAMHNLAMLTAETDTQAARGLLEESIRAKERAGDEAGAVGSLLCRGLIEAREEHPREARRWFDRAVRAAQKTDQRHAHVIALCNSATAAVELGDAPAAKELYERTRQLAEQEQDGDGLLLALTGEARVLDELKQFPEAEALFRRLHALHTQAGNTEEAVVALHDVGVMLLRQGKGSAGRRLFGEALTQARKAGILEWVERCHTDMALSFDEVGKSAEAIRCLRESAVAEERARRFVVAAGLWENLAMLQQRRGGERPLIDEAYRRALAALKKCPDALDERLRILGQLYGWRWESNDFEGALHALIEMEAAAAEGKRPEQRARALDQRGVCLQELGRVEEAEQAHRAGLTIARRLPDTEVAEHCLSNLGEALRKRGEAREAIACYLEAERLAQARGDKVEVIATAHNRALALEDLGEHREAGTMLRRCRDRSLRLECWDQYVRALHGLANHAWRRGDAARAEEQYRTALAEAKRRKVEDQLCPLALNYANALRVKGHCRRALQVLRSVAEQFESLPDAHDYLAEVASLLQEAGEGTQAREVWDRSREHARRVADHGTVALASAALAALLEEDGHFADAESELTVALAHEPEPEGRAGLLSQRLRVALKARQERQAKRLYSQILSLAEEHNLREELIDAHMLVGDHAWEADGDPANALEAYTAALVTSVELGGETMVQVGTHAVRRLVTLPAGDFPQRFDDLERSLRRWITRQGVADEQPVVTQFLLWPLRVARRLQERQRTGRGLPSAEKIGDIMHAELLASLESHKTGEAEGP